MSKEENRPCINMIMLISLGASIPAQASGCSHSQVYTGLKYFFVYLWKLRQRSGRCNWPPNHHGTRSEDEDLIFVVPVTLLKQHCVSLKTLQRVSSPKPSSAQLTLENFRWKCLTCFMDGLFGLIFKSVEAPEQFPAELFSTGYMERQQLAISLGGIKNHHLLLHPGVI